MTLRDLSPPEWRYLADVLFTRISKLPKTGTFQPFYNATTWDHDDLYRAAREDAVRSRSAVMQLITDYKVQEAWPRGRYEAKFWLRARCEEAAYFAQELGATNNESSSSPPPPKDARAVLDWLLYDAWDTQLVDYWLADNLGDHTSFENYGTSDEDHILYKAWLERLRNGYYLPKSNE